MLGTCSKQIGNTNFLICYFLFSWTLHMLFEPEQSRKAVWNFSLAGFEHAFLIRNRIVQTSFVRPLRHLGRGRGLWMTTNNSFWVINSYILFSAQAKPQSHLKLWLCGVWTCIPNWEELCSKWLHAATTAPRPSTPPPNNHHSLLLIALKLRIAWTYTFWLASLK